ncbi:MULTISPECIES: phenylacetate--CoA ligase family protein [unclassified Streptomyces]|uniref:phenylacetate--CoA ligase family protein n=1 Tax=unclassified Streptomyces TaxID=2593676 RepID=UPI0007DD0935|nr:AMP-binding protein [Streptomyces sp. SAT1]ANH93869.1 CoF synthetase [Streptomyces sp. SAT1]MYR55581.1 AMP-binding protein [Streptomyces sp. SID625]
MSRSRPELGDWSSPAELAELQRSQLPRVLAQALRSPFYAARYRGTTPPRTADDFAGVEVTAKQDLRDQYPFGMLAVGREHLATYHESSGTAGEPTASYYTEEDWTDLAERFARKWTGIHPSDTFLVRTPYGLVITGHLAQAAGRLRGATVVPGDARSLATPLSRMVRVLKTLDVTLTWCNPTEITMLAAAAKAAGLRPDQDFPHLRAMFTAAEPLTEVRRRRLSEIWGGIPVVEEYGSTETGTIAGQCPEGRMHLWADRAIFEVYDPRTGTLSEAGRGQMVVTPLYRDAMPLLRYNLADDVEVSTDPCGCGWLLPTVTVLGRAGTGHRIGPATVTQQRLEELVFSLPAAYEVMFWRAKAHPDVLELEFEAPEPVRQRAVKELGASLDRELGVPHRITGLAPGTLVPAEALTAQRDILKARYLFAEDEDWDKAVMYF